MFITEGKWVMKLLILGCKISTATALRAQPKCKKSACRLQTICIKAGEQKNSTATVEKTAVKINKGFWLKLTDK